MGYYGRGDYYRGDYYRGDFWSGLANVGKRIVAGAVDLAGGHVGKAVVDVFGSGQSSAAPPPPPEARLAPGSNLPVAAGPAAGGPVSTPSTLPPPPMMTVNGAAPRGYHVSKKTGRLVRNRRMDVLNVKALRRADRRARGFLHATRSIVRHYVAKAPKGKSYIHARRKRK